VVTLHIKESSSAGMRHRARHWLVCIRLQTRAPIALEWYSRAPITDSRNHGPWRATGDLDARGLHVALERRVCDGYLQLCTQRGGMPSICRNAGGAAPGGQG
jgi:hypothetical protein